MVMYYRDLILQFYSQPIIYTNDVCINFYSRNNNISVKTSGCTHMYVF